MDLWIKSQDGKRLSQVKLVTVRSWMVYEGNFPDGRLLGCYSTPERAEEVLSEIQDVLQGASILAAGKGDLKKEEHDRLFELCKKHRALPIVMASHTSEVTVIPRDAVVYMMPSE